jgi:hypothetical protein
MEGTTSPFSRLATTALYTSILLGIIFIVQTFFLTAGGVGWPEYSLKYTVLARAFLHGQVSLLNTPSPKLLALKDPYDLTKSWMYRDPHMHDSVLFEGKYFIYWGPVPALLIAAISWVARQPMPDVGDQFVVWPFVFGTLIVTTLLMWQIKSAYFSKLPKWAIVPGIVSLGLGTPMLFMMARAAVYEAAIVGGQFFLIAGISVAFAGFGKSRPWLLVLAGLFWTLAVGCRISLVPAVGVLALISAWQLWRNASQRKRPAGAWKPITGLFAPLVIGGVLFAYYNFIRFHSIFEFGQRYQLAATETHRLGSADFLSLSHLIPNLDRYFLAMPIWVRRFPFVYPQQPDASFYSRFNLPGDYGMEPCAGLFWTQPFLIFALLSCFWLFAPRHATVEPSEAAEGQPLRFWLISTLSLAALLGFAPVLPMIGSTMRYLMDFAPAATVLATIGFWQTMRWTETRVVLRNIICTIVFLVVIYEAVIGSLMSVTGYYGHFQYYNPHLYKSLVARYSF